MGGLYTEGAREAERTIEEHNDRRRFEIDSQEHGLNMLLADLLDWCDHRGIDFGAQLEIARDTFKDCQS